MRAVVKFGFWVSGLAIACWPLAACNAAMAQTHAAVNPVFEVDFTDAEVSPQHWTLTLHPDGTGHFRSAADKPATFDRGAADIEKEEVEARRTIGIPVVDRNIQLSNAYAEHVFAVAQRHSWFNQKCESHLKVAFQGWKTLSYKGPDGEGSCTFNYSKNREIEQLGDSLVAVSMTILEGARLEVLVEHDLLGLDAEMEFLTEAAADGRAQQICAIRDILERLADDDSVLERVRKRARMLLSQSTT